MVFHSIPIPKYIIRTKESYKWMLPKPRFRDLKDKHDEAYAVTVEFAANAYKDLPDQLATIRKLPPLEIADGKAGKDRKAEIADGKAGTAGKAGNAKSEAELLRTPIKSSSQNPLAASPPSSRKACAGSPCGSLPSPVSGCLNNALVHHPVPSAVAAPVSGDSFEVGLEEEVTSIIY